MVHSDFVHLHVHTQYSLLDGACLLDRLVDKAKEFKLPALAITDHGNLFGVIKFYNLCLKKGIKPIIGCEVYVAKGSRYNRDYRQGEDSNYHLILLAKDEEGYQNLIKLTSLAYLEGFYYRPRIDKELLAQYSRGLIGLSACLKGEIATAIIEERINDAYKLADEYLNIMGKGNFYLEIMDNDIKEQKKVNNYLIKIARDLDIPLVCTNDVHYIYQDESFAHEVLLCIQTQTVLSDNKRFRFGSDKFYFRHPQEMKNAFAHIPEAVKNTLDITQKCNLIFDFSKVNLPSFPLPPGETEDSYLEKICYKNIKNRYPHLSQEIKERLDYELDVIRKTGFSGYFLIVWDLVKFAKDNNIPVGPGRGSAAGSIVSYILGITDIDPLKYNLLFERFLNLERISMPDIDIDFCYEKRQEIINYVSHKYGKDKVAQIITFGTMLAKAVVRDVGRVLGFEYQDVDKIAKMIPSGVGHQVSLREALELNPELKEIYTRDKKVAQLINVAMQLEGLSRHASTHAAGVVISDRPLIERIPIIKVNDNDLVTGFDMDSLEKTGLLKMDFLGLKTLTVINETIKIVRRTQGKDIDIRKIPLDDPKTFALLGEGKTIGVFQLESRGMRDILTRIKPTEFKDLIAVLALYRPGPLGSGMVDDFIARKQGEKEISYLHPKLEPILKETYGIILYQEQTMQIVSSLAGFSLSQADLLRKAIGKKIPEIMEEQRNLFIEGCRKNGISEDIANRIFDLIDYFSGYGFNKSHSTAYAFISYQTAYLKANYPTEFMAALLTSERNNTDKIVEYINEARRMGIKILSADINESYANFTVTNEGIRFGLMAIKNVGRSAVENIINARKEGKFKDLKDFCERIDLRVVNKKVMESLIKCGAFSSLMSNRAQTLVAVNNLVERLSKKYKKNTNQLQLFGEELRTEDEFIPQVEEWPLLQILNFEKKLLGFYLTKHPLDFYENILPYLNICSVEDLRSDNNVFRVRNTDINVCGVITYIKFTTTRKNNERMAIIKVEDRSGGIEVFVFPRIFIETEFLIKHDNIVLVSGKLETQDNLPKLIATRILSMEEILNNVKALNIFVEKGKFDAKRLKEFFLDNKGNVPIYFKIKSAKFNSIKIKTAKEYMIKVTPKFIENLKELVGEKNFLLTL